jgi:aldehyde:ferredoxin oxidoreductase
MKGYAGKILTLDLNDHSSKVESLDQETARRFIGGKGLGSHLITQSVPAGIDPLSPSNVLVLAIGPLTGTRAPTSNRFGAFFKSPLTGIWGESYAGGHLGPQIRKAGYDAVMVTGRSKHPTYASILDDDVSFHDASGLWGSNTKEAEDGVRKEVGEDKVRVMAIGPAGEKMVRFACVCNDYYRQLGRAGVGAVMGSKNLKAIAFRGTGRVELADEEKFEEVVKEVSARIPKDGPMTKFGTPNMVNVQNALGVFPTHYWQKGYFDAHGSINAPTMAKEILDKNKACWNCPVACGKMSSIKEGKYAGTVVEGPEYETLFAFGGLCELADIKSIAKVNEVCDLLGLDTISAGNTIGFAMRAYELGRIQSPFPIKFGDEEVTLKLLDMMAKREGIGNTLADGVRMASKSLGLDDLAVHVKGLEPPGYDPRGYNGMALSYAVGVRGADHLRSTVYAYEMRNVSDRFMVSGKAAFVKGLEDKLAVVDSMVICCFVRDAYEWEDLARLYTYATGLEMNAVQIREAGARAIDVARRFSTREGISRKDDALPRLFHETPFADGSSKAHVVVKADFERMLDEYYQARGWSSDGIPPAER